MALSELQRRILKLLAANRSASSYLAGGAVLNRNWPRLTEDLDVFHDTDEEIGTAADRDIASLKAAGLRVTIDILIYGIVEATVSDGTGSTVVQWMSETRIRFFPLVRDDDWGARLHDADLAVNKVLAASARSKARDHADLLAIQTFYCPLVPLIFAAAGKPPHMSPVRIVEEIRRRVTGMHADEFEAVRGLPSDWTPQVIRESLMAILDLAQERIAAAPVAIVGCLACDDVGRPQLVMSEADLEGVLLRRATDEGEVIPILKDVRPPMMPQ